jgi:hypothetical protein
VETGTGARAKQGGLEPHFVDTLSGEGPFTVFAPANDAFAKLLAGTVDTLLKPENKGQLTLHVIDTAEPAVPPRGGLPSFSLAIAGSRRGTPSRQPVRGSHGARRTTHHHFVGV